MSCSLCGEACRCVSGSVAEGASASVEREEFSSRTSEAAPTQETLLTAEGAFVARRGFGAIEPLSRKAEAATSTISFVCV